ncbi:MAG: preprotein translocase subunit SecG [Hyphomicrobiaceae bacterium]|nr:preprotein translocase subunit SecG [Hyphomicrobiaceae bacterium]
MATVLLVVHIMIALALIVVVLMQRSEGGALGIGGGGGGGFLTGRGTANLLTRMTAALALCFFTTSILLTILANRGPTGSVFDRPSAAGPEAPSSAGTPAPGQPAGAPAGGTILDSLEQPTRTPLPSVPGTR